MYGTHHKFVRTLKMRRNIQCTMEHHKSLKEFMLTEMSFREITRLGVRGCEVDKLERQDVD